MSDLNIIKSKIKKLLALSKSPNENEAALALKKATELMAQYKINESEFSGYTMKSVKATKRYVEWRAIVANAVENLYVTYHYRNINTGEFIFYGEELDVFMSTEMFSYLIKTIDRMASRNIRKNAKYHFRQSYRSGLASRLYDRMEELGQNCSWRNPEELAKAKQEICDYVNNSNWQNEHKSMVPRKKRRRRNQPKQADERVARSSNQRMVRNMVTVLVIIFFVSFVLLSFVGIVEEMLEKHEKQTAIEEDKNS